MVYLHGLREDEHKALQSSKGEYWVRSELKAVVQEDHDDMIRRFGIFYRGILSDRTPKEINRTS